MSLPPCPPARLLWKNIKCPSMDRAGAASTPVVLRADTFTGACQSHSLHARWDTQMSLPPTPPGRSDVKKRLSSSFDRSGCASVLVALTAARFTGADQGVPSVENIIAVMPFPGAEGSARDDGSHPASSASGVNEAKMRDLVLMGPPSVQFRFDGR